MLTIQVEARLWRSSTDVWLRLYLEHPLALKDHGEAVLESLSSEQQDVKEIHPVLGRYL